MKKNYILFVSLALTASFLKAQESMVIHQSGGAATRFTVSTIDSVVFNNIDAVKKEITVGGPDSDIQGFTNQAVQQAVDALPPEGGTVKLSAGTFTVMGPVKLKSNVSLIGSGDSTVFKRIDGYRSKITIDADLGESKATVANSIGFKAGMSVQFSDNVNNQCEDISIAVITKVEGNTLYFDKMLGRNYRVKDNGIVTNAGSCISIVEVQHVYVSKVKIDGNKAKNDLLDGCFGGGIAITLAQNITIDSVVVSNFNGEGITWQNTDSVTVMNCDINGCKNNGMHPGIGSPHTKVLNNNSYNNGVGLFLCWRVTDGLVKGNQLHHNSQFGISTGHKDTDMLFDSNHIYLNGINGVEYRDEITSNSPHRNTFINNIIEDNGTINEGSGFHITGYAQNILIKDNIIRNNAGGKQKAAITKRSYSPLPILENNTISGHRLGDGIVTE